MKIIQTINCRTSDNSQEICSKVKKLLDGKYPVEVIDMRDYGTMNGPKVLDAALKIYDEFYK